MLDSHLHPRLKPLLNVCAARLDRLGVSADGVTLTGFAIGVLALPFLGLRWYGAALAAIVVNRLLDGLDGALARRRGLSDAGDFSIFPSIFCFMPWYRSGLLSPIRRKTPWPEAGCFFLYRNRQQFSRLCRAGGQTSDSQPGLRS